MHLRPSQRLQSHYSQSFHNSKYTPFEERCNQLLRFKEEFGHCIIPGAYEGNPSLGRWCRSMRTTYRKIQKGTQIGGANLEPDRIKRLEDIGFEWHAPDAVFHKRCQEPVAFKKEFGHFNVPHKSYPSLERWFRGMRNV